MLGDATLPMGPREKELAQTLSLERQRPPTHVPGCTPERFLGKGAYGEVWLARDLNTGRRVAVKFFAHREGLDWSLLSREVEKLRFLFNNRFVVQLLEVGWDARPPYYVMEYFDRGSLEDHLRRGPLPVAEALEIFREAALALAHSHERGVLHCDLKPANILLDDDGRPRLADFGQARMLTDQSPVLGTLFYMAPEQADLTVAPDSRWDVYALGAILYRMLTGSPPFQTPELQSKIADAPTLAERLSIYRKGVRSAPKPAAHRKAPGVDKELAEIVDRCLAVDPKRRFASPQMILQALEARALNQARRPLLVLGGFGPLLVLLVLTVVGVSGFLATIRYTSDALLARTSRNNHFAARFVAQTVANQFHERWSILEEAALDLRGLLLAVERMPGNEEARHQLQSALDQWQKSTASLTRATSWFLNDASGVQLARSPHDAATVGRNYAWRDYFHGHGKDLPPDAPGIAPIQEPHLSPPFISTSTKTRMVAFSVPVWSGPPGSRGRKVLGVLAMTVETGDFGELQSDESSDKDGLPQRFAVLVDTREDSKGERGLILQHPVLRNEDEEPGEAPADHRFAPQIVDRMLALRTFRRTGQKLPPDLAEIRGAIDPALGDGASKFLMSIEPVSIASRPASVGDTGLVVVVQDREEDLLRPIEDLRNMLLVRGLVAIGLLVLVSAATWTFVVSLMNAPRRSSLARLLRREAGLPSETSSASSERGGPHSGIGPVGGSESADEPSVPAAALTPAKSTGGDDA